MHIKHLVFFFKILIIFSMCIIMYRSQTSIELKNLRIMSSNLMCITMYAEKVKVLKRLRVIE